MIKHKMLLGSDFDGTLRRTGDAIAKEDIQAIRTFQAANLFGIVSGREPRSLFAACRQYDIPIDFIIAYGGGMILDPDGRCLKESPLCGPLDELIDFLRHNVTMSLTVYGKDALWNERMEDDPEMEQLIARIHSAYPQADDPRDLHEICVISCMMHDHEEALALTAQIGLQFPQVHAAVNCECIDISARGVDKAQALDWAASHFGIVNDRVAAIGDSLNDLTMIRRFQGFAIRGNPQLAQYTDHIVDNVVQAISILMRQ